MAYIQAYRNTELPQLTEHLFQFLFSIKHSVDQETYFCLPTMENTQEGHGSTEMEHVNF